MDYPIRKKRHHAHNVENDEPTNKRFRIDKDDSDEECVLISTLTAIISHGINDWIVDSGAYKHMMGCKESFINMSEHDSPHKVKLGDDYQYPIKGSGVASYKLDSGKSLKMKDVSLCSSFEEESSLHLCARCKENESWICQWPTSNVS